MHVVATPRSVKSLPDSPPPSCVLLGVLPSRRYLFVTTKAVRSFGTVVLSLRVFLQLIVSHRLVHPVTTNRDRIDRPIGEEKADRSSIKQPANQCQTISYLAEIAITGGGDIRVWERLVHSVALRDNPQRQACLV